MSGLFSKTLRGDPGFTLIEALVALAVLAAGLAAIGELGFQSVAAARRAETRFFLASAARKAFAALPVGRVDGGSIEGEIDGAAWRLRSSPFAFDLGGAPAAAVWTPTAIRLVVASPSGGKITIDTVRLAPTGATP